MVLGVGERDSLNRYCSGRRLGNIQKYICLFLSAPTSPEPTVLLLLGNEKTRAISGCFDGAGSRSRTYEGRSRQIYSLMRLTTSLSQRVLYYINTSAPKWQEYKKTTSLIASRLYCLFVYHCSAEVLDKLLVLCLVCSTVHIPL